MPYKEWSEALTPALRSAFVAILQPTSPTTNATFILATLANLACSRGTRDANKWRNDERAFVSAITIELVESCFLWWVLFPSF